MEKEGAFGNAERCTRFWRQQVKAPGQARSDLWQYIEFSKRFKTDEVWPAALRLRVDCNDCMDCFEVCPEPQVIRPALKGAGKGVGPVILAATCTNCGRCIDVCSKDVFTFGLRFSNPPANGAPPATSPATSSH